MTPLQTAVKAVIAKYAIDSTAIPCYMFGELRKALDAEMQQTREPVGYVYWVKGHAEGALDDQSLKPGTPLFTHPAPPPAGERAALIKRLRTETWSGFQAMASQAAAMLEADAREIEGMECDYTDQVMRAIAAEVKLAQQVAVPLGYALAMAVLQSSLYQWLDDVERGECDALVAAGQSPHGDKQ